MFLILKDFHYTQLFRYTCILKPYRPNNNQDSATSISRTNNKRDRDTFMFTRPSLT